MNLGVIVGSNSHIDYVCQVYGPGETDREPLPHEHALGTFVAVGRADGGYLVGLIYDTRLLNPDYGALGPRLSSESQLQVFSPDYLLERATLVGILAIGGVDAYGRVEQGLPRVAARVDAPVRRLDESEVAAFHTVEGAFAMRYWPMLAALNLPLVQQLLLHVLGALAPLFPDEAARLAVIRRDVLWKSQIMPLGRG